MKRAGRCIICGDENTVKSHLLPRALVLDMRGSGKFAVSGSRHRKGVLFEQNGEWDDTILCKEHEDKVGKGDDYAINLIRGWRKSAKASPVPNSLLLPNPEPKLLLHFIYATVWRVVVSRAGKRSGASLGIYEPIFRQAVLEQRPFDLQCVVGITQIGLRQSEPSNFAIYPFRTKFGRLNSWMFGINNMTFNVITDQRRLKTTFNPYLANENDPVVASVTEEMDMREVRIFKPIFQNMVKK